MTETFDPAFLERLAQLNQVIAATGEPVEGNLFYYHEDGTFPNAKIAPPFEGKRANMLAATKGRGRILEIGTNGGHTALWLLHHHPGLHYTGVDICRHHYTQKAVDHLKQLFPGRVDFHAGDSIEILPKLASSTSRPFDIVHIDGAHDTHHVVQDFLLSSRLCVPFAWIIFDDMEFSNVVEFYERLLADKKLLKKAPDGWVANDSHTIGMLPD